MSTKAAASQKRSTRREASQDLRWAETRAAAKAFCEQAADDLEEVECTDRGERANRPRPADEVDVAVEVGVTHQLEQVNGITACDDVRRCAGGSDREVSTNTRA